MKRVLLTGGLGYIGSHTAVVLAAGGDWCGALGMTPLRVIRKVSPVRANRIFRIGAFEAGEERINHSGAPRLLGLRIISVVRPVTDVTENECREIKPAVWFVELFTSIRQQV